MKYKKKPIIVEAIQWTGSLLPFIPWMDELGSLPLILNPLPTLTIQTLEGDMVAQLGDYIIRGVKNEFYPCREDIFKQTYEEVTDVKNP